MKFFSDSGRGGGEGSCLPMTICSTSSGLSSPRLSMMRKVSIVDTMSLCLSKSPRRVYWKAQYEIDSIRSRIRCFSWSGVIASSISSVFYGASPAGAYCFFSGYFCSAGFSAFSAAGSEAGAFGSIAFFYSVLVASPSGAPPSILVVFFFPGREGFSSGGIIALPLSSIGNIFTLPFSSPGVIKSIARLITTMNDYSEYL